MIIAIDFDDTIFINDYPNIGDEIENSINVLHKLMKKDHKLILFTMRSGKVLDEAIYSLTRRGIKLYGINQNPQQAFWTTSPKAYADYYIDDRSLGCPLGYNKKYGKNVVDWYKIEKLLENKNIL